MAKGTQGKLIAFKKCRWCGEECEVREDKKQNPYSVCFGCPSGAPGSGASQEFTYGVPARIAKFKAEGWRPVKEEKPAAPPPAPPPPPPAPPVAKKKRGGSTFFDMAEEGG